MAQAKAQLEALRQRAVSAEAFELAARIDGERRGLEWISSVQRVTNLSGEDADVFAWVARCSGALRCTVWAASGVDIATIRSCRCDLPPQGEPGFRD